MLKYGLATIAGKKFSLSVGVGVSEDGTLLGGRRLPREGDGRSSFVLIRKKK